MTKKILLFSIILFSFSFIMTAQNNVGINTTTPNASAALDVQSTTQGLLPPRMTYTQRQAIASPATGLVVFCTDCGVNGGELEVYAAGMWRNMAGSNAAILPAIGQITGGGIVAYILQPGDPGYDANVTHGLIAATSDQSIGAAWGCFHTVTVGADGSAIGTGNQNTIDIMNGCSTLGIAARLCGDLVLNNYSDWYLPSIDELQELYWNIGPGAPAPNTNIGGFANDGYWSSTESFLNWDAVSLGFFSGVNSGVPYYYGIQIDLHSVRAIRSF